MAPPRVDWVAGRYVGSRGRFPLARRHRRSCSRLLGVGDLKKGEREGFVDFAAEGFRGGAEGAGEFGFREAGGEGWF